MRLPPESQPSETNCKHNYQGLTVGTTQYHRAGCDDVHFHENPTICFLLNGGATERRNQAVYERYAGDARFYHSAEPHQSSVRLFPSKCINFEFEAVFLRRYVISENALSSAVTRSPAIKFTMLRIYREFLADAKIAQSSIEMLLFELLDAKRKNVRKIPPWLPVLRDLLRDRWAETLSLDELSVAVGAHPVTISKYFRYYFSCSLGEYMRRLKIEKSLSLIKSTQLPLTEIALRCGFADQSHFTRNFKEMIGFLPKNFRQL